MSSLITYGINTLSGINSPSDITNNYFIVNGSTIVDTSFNLELNYSIIPTNPVLMYYTITAIRLE